MTGGKFTKIVLSGAAGSGKSTVGKMLARQLGWPFLSMGDFSRRYALEKYGMNINEFQDLCKADPGIDKLLEEAFIKECNIVPTAVIDYRLGFHFIPDALHVYLQVSEEEAIRRVGMAGRRDEDAGEIPRRNKQMRDRFLDRYGIDFMDLANYDFVIDTDRNTVESICRDISELEK